MSGVPFSESVVEDAALAWLESLGWQVKYGPDVAPECIALAALRDTLLPKLLSNEIRVKNVGRPGKEALHEEC